MDKLWFDEVRQSALGWTSSVETTYDVCRTALERGIPGDFVECGVYIGAQAAVMARAILDCHSVDTFLDGFAAKPPTRRVHLFDSFEGIPLAGPEDVEFIREGHPAGLSSCSLKNVKERMQHWGIPDEMLVYHPGMFEDTVRPGPLGRLPWADLMSIAVLRLDGDLYRSTKVCMEHLYPLVSPGGYVIVDDFDLSGCRQAVLESIYPAPIYWRKPSNESASTR